MVLPSPFQHSHNHHSPSTISSPSTPYLHSHSTNEIPPQSTSPAPTHLSSSSTPSTPTSSSSSTMSVTTSVSHAKVSFKQSLTASSSQISQRLRCLSVSAVQQSAQNVAAALQTHIEFVPATVPRARRLQTLCVALWALTLPITYCFFIYLCSFPALWPLLVTYVVWMVWIDESPERGGRSSQWFRSMRFWTYFAEYYPASMRKEQDLPADRPYVFGYHPHGIIGMGALATFATESTGFSKAFPGIRPHLLTLASNFRVPIYRDILLALGVCSVSKASCSNILKQGKGSAICIVVGGAAESLSAHPGTADLTLRKRLGFIKLAIQYGADLVPVFSFGENDIFQQMPNERGTMTYAMQKKFQSVFGFTLPLFHGRGMLNYNLGLMPYRRRIVSIIGRPINVERCENPDLDRVREVQERYIAELYRIWEAYKDVFATDRKREMSIID